MKRVLAVMFFGMVMVLSSAAFADREGCGCGMMGGGMTEHRGMMEHHGMMGGERREHGGMMGEMMEEHHHMMQMMMTTLGLDEKQKETIKGIKHRTMKEMIRKKADIKIAEIELKELMGKDPVDMKAVEAKMKQVEGLRTDMHMTFIKAREEVNGQLTAEQKKKMKEMMERHRTMGGTGCGMEHHMGGMKGGMCGDMGKGMMGGMCGGDCKCGHMEHHEGMEEGGTPTMEHKH